VHEAHGFRAELVGVVDGGDSGLDGVERAGLSGGVNADAGADTGGFGDGGFEFGAGVLVGSGEGAVDEAVRAGLVILMKSAPSLSCWRMTLTRSAELLA
jgi:hypothetical protein